MPLLAKQRLPDTRVSMRMTRRLPKDRFIYELLRGKYKSEMELLEHAELLRLDLRLPQSVILIDAADYILNVELRSERLATREEQRRAKKIMENILSPLPRPAEVTCAYLGFGHIVVLRPDKNLRAVTAIDAGQVGAFMDDLVSPQQLTKVLNRRLANGSEHKVRISVGRAYAGIKGLSRSYREALTALYGPRYSSKARRAQGLDELSRAGCCSVENSGGKPSGLS